MSWTPAGSSLNDQVREDEQLLKKWLYDCPGLADWAYELFCLCGICTVGVLGTISDRKWEEALSFIPQKRIDHPEDLWDRKRKGPGHLNSLDELRKRARQFVRRRGKPGTSWKGISGNLGELSGGLSLRDHGWDKWMPEPGYDGMMVEPPTPRRLKDPNTLDAISEEDGEGLSPTTTDSEGDDEGLSPTTTETQLDLLSIEVDLLSIEADLLSDVSVDEQRLTELEEHWGFTLDDLREIGVQPGFDPFGGFQGLH